MESREELLEQTKEYLRRVDELELKLTGEDKETLQWLLFGYNECARLLEEKEYENFNLKEYINVEKMSIPYDGSSFEQLLDMPTYNQLEERWEELKHRVRKWWEISETKSGVKLGLRMVLDEMESLEKEDK